MGYEPMNHYCSKWRQKPYQNTLHNLLLRFVLVYSDDPQRYVEVVGN